MVVMARFLKYLVFIPVPHEYTMNVAVGPYFKNVVKYFGIHEDIVSDRDSRFYRQVLDHAA